MNEKATVETTAGNTDQPISDEAQTLIDDAMEQVGDSPEQIEAKEEQEQAGPQIPTAELLAPAVAVICAVACPNWEIGKAEQTALIETYSALLDKYFPGGLDFGPELACLIVTAGIFMPRMGKPAQLQVIEAEKAGADDAEA